MLIAKSAARLPETRLFDGGYAMEKEKNKLPYYIKIEKTKDGVPIIHVRKFRWIRLVYLLLVLGLIAAMFYFFYRVSVLEFVLNFLIVAVLPFPILAFPVTLGLLSVLVHLFINVIWIRLEPETLSVKRRMYGMYSPVTVSVQELLAVQVVPHLSFKPTIKKDLIANFQSGRTLTLADDLEDTEALDYLCDFISNYYGLNEKAKNEKPVTTN